MNSSNLLESSINLLKNEEGSNHLISGTQPLYTLLNSLINESFDQESILNIDENLFYFSSKEHAAPFMKDEIEEAHKKLTRLKKQRVEFEKAQGEIAGLQNQLDVLMSTLKKKSLLTDQVVNKLNNIKTKLDLLAVEINIQQQENKKQILECKGLTESKNNSITLRIFRPTEDRQKTVLGFPTTGHLSLSIRLANGKEKYISFYPEEISEDKLSIVDSTLSGLAKIMRLPTLQKFSGKFHTFDHDKSYLISGEYESCEELIIECDQINDLNINKIYLWANNLLKNPDAHYFQAYTHNCTTICLEGLKTGGIGNLMPNHKHKVDLPQQVFDEISMVVDQLFSQILTRPSNEQRPALEVLIESTIKSIGVLTIEGDKINPPNKQLFLKKLSEISNILQKFQQKELGENEYETIDSLAKELQEVGDSFITESSATIVDKNAHKINLQSVYGPLISLLAIKNLISYPTNCGILTRELVFQSLFYTNLKSILSQKTTNMLFSLVGWKENIFTTFKFTDLQELNQALEKDEQLRGVLRIMNFINENLISRNDPNHTLKLFNKILKLQEVIVFLEKEIGECSNLSFKNFYIDTINSLREMLGVFNQIQYFNSESLNQLIQIMPTSKEHTTNEENKLPDLKDVLNKSTEIFKNTHLLTAQDKTKSSLETIVKSINSSFTQKLITIKQTINEQKPSWWKFWRYKERAWYDQIQKDTVLICIIDNFIKGELHVLNLVVALQNFAKTYKVPGAAHLAMSLKTQFDKNAAAYDKTHQESLQHAMKEKISNYAKVYQALQSNGIKKEFPPTVHATLSKFFEAARSISPSEDGPNLSKNKSSESVSVQQITEALCCISSDRTGRYI